MAVSELKSNISNANLNKNKRKLFLYLDKGHTNRTSTTKKIRFFSYIDNIKKSLKKTDEKKCCFKCV